MFSSTSWLFLTCQHSYFIRSNSLPLNEQNCNMGRQARWFPSQSCPAREIFHSLLLTTFFQKQLPSCSSSLSVNPRGFPPSFIAPCKTWKTMVSPQNMSIQNQAAHARSAEWQEKRDTIQTWTNKDQSSFTLWVLTMQPYWRYGHPQQIQLLPRCTLKRADFTLRDLMQVIFSYSYSGKSARNLK